MLLRMVLTHARMVCMSDIVCHGGPQSVGTMEAELASLQQLNAGLQRDLARFQEREDLLKQARRLLHAARHHCFAARSLAGRTRALLRCTTQPSSKC